MDRLYVRIRVYPYFGALRITPARKRNSFKACFVLYYTFKGDNHSSSGDGMFTEPCISFIVRIMEKSIDSTAVDRGPVPNNNMFFSLYYVTFVVVYSFFFLNIFVALIIVTFQEQGEKEITGSELDKNQV